jgi:hypothetical protein
MTKKEKPLSLNRIFADFENQAEADQREWERGKAAEYLFHLAHDLLFEHGQMKTRTQGVSSGKPGVIGLWLEPVECWLTPRANFPVGKKDSRPFWLERGYNPGANAFAGQILLKSLYPIRDEEREVTVFTMSQTDALNWRGQPASPEEIAFARKLLATMDRIYSTSLLGKLNPPHRR